MIIGSNLYRYYYFLVEKRQKNMVGIKNVTRETRSALPGKAQRRRVRASIPTRQVHRAGGGQMNPTLYRDKRGGGRGILPGNSMGLLAGPFMNIKRKFDISRARRRECDVDASERAERVRAGDGKREKDEEGGEGVGNNSRIIASVYSKFIPM